MAIKQQTYSRLTFNICILILANILSSMLFFRLDLTTDKRHSLSDASKEILKELDDILYVKVYLEGDFPAGFTRLKNATHQLLNEFRSYSSYVEYEFINPSESTNQDERNSIYRQLFEQGLKPHIEPLVEKNVRSEQIIFPGAIIYYKGESTVVNLLQKQIEKNNEVLLNNSIENLEYEFSTNILKLSNNDKPKIAFLEGNGELEKLERSGIEDAVGNTKGSLSEFYQVESFNIKEFETDSLQTNPSVVRQQEKLNSFSAIIIAKPKIPFNDLEKLFLDQYIMQGGKILWFLDGVNMNMDSLQGNAPYTTALPKYLAIEDMLFKYGVRINADLVMDWQADKISVVTGSNGDIPQQSLFHWPYNPLISTKETHVISKNLDAIRSSFVSTMDTIKSSFVKKSIVLTTSPNSKVVKTPHRVSLNILRNKPLLDQYNAGPQNIGILLEGTFKSFFENRLTSKNQTLLTRSKPTSMLIVSDGDIIKNHVTKSGKPYPLGYNHNSNEYFQGNSSFIINSLHYMLGKKELIEVRGNNFKIRLLDREKIYNDRLYWQTINIGLPIVLLLFIGLVWSWRRKKKYV